MKRLLILVGAIATLFLVSAIVSAHPDCSDTHSHARLTCQLCHGTACPKATKSGVCNCTVFYRCPNENCSLTVCNGCYYKYVLPNLNKGCPGCKGHKQFKQVH